MHSRRVAAFILGAWLFGAFLMWFVAGQSEATAERFLVSPPASIAPLLAALGSDGSRSLLTQQAWRLNRHLLESWVMAQLGIGAALIAACVLTSHRNRTLIAGATLMTVLAGVGAFVITPQVSAITQAAEVRAATSTERSSLHSLEIWQRALELLKVIIGAALVARLLVDRAVWHFAASSDYRNMSRTRPAKVRRSDG